MQKYAHFCKNFVNEFFLSNWGTYLGLRPFEANSICMTSDLKSKIGRLTQAGKNAQQDGVTFGKNRSVWRVGWGRCQF